MRTSIPIARWIQFPGLLLIFFGLASASWAQSEPLCQGPMNDRHPQGNFDFETNSRVVKKESGQYKFAIISCVSNNDTKHSVFVNWRIPHRTGWVPVDQKIDTPPILIIQNDVIQLDGCLEYGNRGDFITASFFGTDDDKKAVESEKANGCRAAAAGKASSGGMTIEDIILKVRNFFPSDVKVPDSTMLQLDGEVGIKKTGPNQYQSYFSYEVNRYKDSPAGTVQNITIRPAFAGSTESLLGSFFRHNQKIVSLQPKGTIAFDVTGIENPSLSYARYEIYSQKDQLIAAIELPVFVSSPSSKIKLGSR